MADWRTILTDRQTDKIRLSFRAACFPYCNTTHRGKGLIAPSGTGAFLRLKGGGAY